MFAIISGLGHAAVSRLKSSWEKLPSKYIRLFADMQQLMDPSRNMSRFVWEIEQECGMILMNACIFVHRYRNLVNGENVQPPIIPFYPVVKKDLTFIHLANDTTVEGLVNFEKLRMIAKEVSQNFCSRHCSFSFQDIISWDPTFCVVETRL